MVNKLYLFNWKLKILYQFLEVSKYYKPLNQDLIGYIKGNQIY